MYRDATIHCAGAPPPRCPCPQSRWGSAEATQGGTYFPWHAIAPSGTSSSGGGRTSTGIRPVHAAPQNRTGASSPRTLLGREEAVFAHWQEGWAQAPYSRWRRASAAPGGESQAINALASAQPGVYASTTTLSVSKLENEKVTVSGQLLVPLRLHLRAHAHARTQNTGLCLRTH